MSNLKLVEAANLKSRQSRQRTETAVQASTVSAPARAQNNLWRRGLVLARIAEIAAHVVWEELTSPTARKASDVPHNPSAISAEWLTNVLCREIPGARVEAVELAGGSSGTSTREALDLTPNAAAVAGGIPNRVFTKSTTNLKQRLLLGLSKVIYGEVGFYNHFRPRVEIEAPKGYFACVAPRSLRSMILMEDIVLTKGAVFITPEMEITKADMADLLANLAKLHAKFWDAPNLSRDHPWLRDARRYIADNNRLIDMKQRAKTGTLMGRDLLPTGMQGRMDDIWEGILAYCDQDVRRPMTVLHGDAHIAQTYKTRDGRMGFADWQVLLRGNWAWDVSYIVSTGLTVENRRLWEKDLLAHYQDALAAAGGPALPFDEVWADYRRHVLYAYVAWAFTLGYASPDHQVQPNETTVALVHRTGHAIVDLDSIAAAKG